MSACAGAQANTVQVGSPLTGSFTSVWLALYGGGQCVSHCNHLLRNSKAPR